MGFYLTYTARLLRRQGQHTILIIVSVAFGVMALVTMQLLNTMIAEALLEDQRIERGGDLHIEQSNDEYLTEADIAQIDTLRVNGQIETYTLISRTYAMLIKREGDTKTGITMYAQGVDPEVFPLLGSFQIREPHNATLAETIRPSKTIAITRDLADDMNLKVGDPVVVTDGMGGAPQRLIIGGVIEMSPSHMAKSAYYSLETARLLANNQQAITGAELIVNGNQQTIADTLSASGWTVLAADDFSEGEKKVRIVFNFGLKGAGILALLVGGIGVANTMQVVLARRSTEVAILKTMGYRRWHLMLMFGIETALIGAVGSLIGTGAALLVGHPLARSMERTGIFLLEWHVEPQALISGALAGIATSLIFGFYAILRASAVRPAAMLRHFETSKSWHQWLSAIGVYAVLVIPFGVVSIFILGSVTQGIGVILLALVGFVVLGLIMGSALWLVTRLPMSGMFKLARNNLKRQKMSLVFALIALFIGVVAISIAAATMIAAQEEMDEQLASLEGTNLGIYARADQEAEIQAKIATLKGVKSLHVRHMAELPALDVLINDEWQPVEITWLEGRQYAEPAWGLDLFGADWGGSLQNAYLPDTLRDLYGGLQPGMVLRLRDVSGDVQELTLAGFFQRDNSQSMTMTQRSVIVDQSVLDALGSTQSTALFEGEIDVDQLNAVSKTLSDAFPGAMVISASDLREVIQGMLFSLFAFVITVAGFALVAGAVLISNAVGLSVIERRHEIGVMKTVGYTSRHVLLTLVLEHSQLGVLAGVLGTLAVKVAFRIVREAQPDVVLSLDFVTGLAVIAVCTGFALVSVLWVAWRPTRVPPLVILRGE